MNSKQYLENQTRRLSIFDCGISPELKWMFETYLMLLLGKSRTFYVLLEFKLKSYRCTGDTFSLLTLLIT